MKPPFKPAAGRADDAFYFDPEFTSKTPQGTCYKSIVNKIFTILIVNAIQWNTDFSNLWSLKPLGNAPC